MCSGKLQSFNEWNEILHDFKHTRGRCDTNCYVSAQAINEYILNERMRYAIYNDTLWLFEKEKGYSIAYFYVAKDSHITCARTDEKQIVYLIGSEDDYKSSRREAELIVGGFEKYKKNLEYIFKKEDKQSVVEIDKKCDRVLKKLGCHYAWLQEHEDYEAIYELWREQIDFYSVKYALPSRIDGMIKNKECMAVRNEEDDIVAAMCYSINGIRAFQKILRLKIKNLIWE